MTRPRQSGDPAPGPARPLVWVVSGLPRSGTSMLMQMVEAAGLPLLVDGRRGADADNPRGYFEFEPVKALARDSSFLGAAVGRGVKVVAPLVRFLPDSYDYAVFFIERPIEAVLSSQRSMLARRAGQTARPADESEESLALSRAFEASVRDAKAVMRDGSNFRVHFIDHGEVMTSPRVAAASMLEFIAEVDERAARDTPRHGDLIERVAAVVEPSLCRQGGPD